MANNTYGGGNQNWNTQPQNDADLADPTTPYFSDTRFEFRVLLETEGGYQLSYCGYQEKSSNSKNPPIFIDTQTDGYFTSSRWATFDGGTSPPYPQYIFTTGEIAEKVIRMASCSFHDYPSSSFGMMGGGSDLSIHSNYPVSSRFGVNDWLGVETGSLATIMDDNNNRPSDTGSFQFVQKENTADPLKRFKFYGGKICNMLGLPEGQWLYTDAVRVDADEDRHVFQGSATFNEITSLNSFAISNTGNVSSDLPLKVDPITSERWLRIVDNRGTVPANRILVGYQGDVSRSYSQAYNRTPAGSFPNFKISTTGNVGAGTLDPLYPLHVRKSWDYANNQAKTTDTDKPAAYIEGNLDVDGYITSSRIIMGRSNGATALIMHNHADDDTYMSFTTDNIGFRVGNHHMYINPTGWVGLDLGGDMNAKEYNIENVGKLGVGLTTEPSNERVEIRSNVFIHGSGSFGTDMPYDTKGYGVRFQNPGASNSFWINTISGSKNHLGIGGKGSNAPASGAINIGASGRVGVGVLNPTAKFDVSGSMNSSEPVMKVQGNSGSLFEVWDSFEESYFSVSDISGIPIIDCKVDESVWIHPTLQNSWVWYGSSYERPAFFKDAMGFVHLRGLLKNGTLNTAMFTLPVGYRPARRVVAPGVCNSSHFVRIDITTTGEVGTVAAANDDAGYVSIDSISFYVGHTF